MKVHRVLDEESWSACLWHWWRCWIIWTSHRCWLQWRHIAEARLFEHPEIGQRLAVAVLPVGIFYGGKADICIFYTRFVLIICWLTGASAMGRLLFVLLACVLRLREFWVVGSSCLVFAPRVSSEVLEITLSGHSFFTCASKSLRRMFIFRQVTHCTGSRSSISRIIGMARLRPLPDRGFRQWGHELLVLSHCVIQPWQNTASHGAQRGSVKGELQMEQIMFGSIFSSSMYS